MVRPVNLVERPTFPPYVCIRCGLGAGENDRKYFVDLGIDLHYHFNPLHDGNIYFCDQCLRGLITDANRLISTWDQEHAEWQSPDRVEASYSWESQIDLSNLEVENGRGPNDSGSTDSVESGVEGIEFSPVGSSEASESADEIPDGAVPNVSTEFTNSLNVVFGLGAD